MKSKTLIAVLVVIIFGLALIMAGCSKNQEEAISTENSEQMSEEMPMDMEMSGQDDTMVACAYDGMHMKQKAMAATMEYEGETLYFCTEGHQEKFAETPDQYRKVLDLSGNVRAIVNIMPNPEYMTAMKDMGMEMDMPMGKATHHAGVTLVDTQSGNSIEGAEVTLTISAPSGGSRDMALKYMPMMGHYGMGVNLPASGDYNIGIKASCDGETTESKFDYTVKGGGS